MIHLLFLFYFHSINLTINSYFNENHNHQESVIMNTVVESTLSVKANQKKDLKWKA